MGDYIDRGKESRLVVKKIRELTENNENVIALMGNHEDMLIDWYKYGVNMLECNGYKETMKSYDGYYKDLLSDIHWMENLPLYYETDDCIFVHAGANLMLDSMKEQRRDVMLWTRDDFYHCFEPVIKKRVVFGHTPTELLTGLDVPVIIGNCIDIDTGCVFNGKLTAIMIDGGKVEYMQTGGKNNE